jgi:hypothetical protein
MNSQQDEPTTPATQSPANLGTNLANVATVSIGNRGKTPLTSQKLGRTLKELETAFNEWESLGTRGGLSGGTSGKTPVNTSTPATPELGNAEFRVKTKKLLSQLRQQLDELNE